jgi:hypothetical protein
VPLEVDHDDVRDDEADRKVESGWTALGIADAQAGRALKRKLLKHTEEKARLSRLKGRNERQCSSELRADPDTLRREEAVASRRWSSRQPGYERSHYRSDEP